MTNINDMAWKWFCEKLSIIALLLIIAYFMPPLFLLIVAWVAGKNATIADRQDVRKLASVSIGALTAFVLYFLI